MRPWLIASTYSYEELRLEVSLAEYWLRWRRLAIETGTSASRVMWESSTEECSTRPMAWMSARVRPSASGMRSERVTTGSMGRARSMRRSNCSVPSPVMAEMRTGPFSLDLAAGGWDSDFRWSGVRESTLFCTRGEGGWCAP